MAPHAVTRRDASARRTHHAAALLADARRLEPLRAAALGPFEHRQLRLAAANQPGIEQLARLDLPRPGAAIVEDDVLIVPRAALRYRHLPADPAQTALDRLRGQNGRAPVRAKVCAYVT